MSTVGRSAVAVALACAATALGACGGTPLAIAGPPPGVALQSLTVTSKSFTTRGPIPVDYTCDGANRSPQLTWSAPPKGTVSFAFITTDPGAAGGEWIHWVAYGIPGDATSFPEAGDLAGAGASIGMNSFGHVGYEGPCPPKMELHDYAFRVYALDVNLPARSSVTADDLLAMMNGHVLAVGSLVGTFSH